jgi:GTP-binding protein HflX
VPGLSTELEDVTEVEYRQLRLENVVLVGCTPGSQEDAENSLRELAALAETAGAVVLDGCCSGVRIPTRRPTSAAARRRSCATSSPRSAPTPSSPTRSSLRASVARWRTSSR